jgi:hypothetical protein
MRIKQGLLKMATEVVTSSVSLGADLVAFSGVDKDSPEWQAKMEERKAEMDEWKAMSPEERQAKMEEFRANRPNRPENIEEWQAKMEEFKANRIENGEWKGRGLRFGHFPDLRGFDEVDYEVVNLENGVQITITSEDPGIVQKLQDAAARYNK